MSQEALEVRLTSLSLTLDVETGELLGLLTLQTSLGEVTCPVEAEIVQELLHQSMTGHLSQSTSNFHQDFLVPEEEMESPESPSPMVEYKAMEEPGESLLDFHQTNVPRQPASADLSPQGELDDLESQIRTQMTNAARESTTRKLGVETITDGGTFEEEADGETKIP